MGFRMATTLLRTLSAVIMALPVGSYAQETTLPVRLRAQNIFLTEAVAVDSGSSVQALAGILRSAQQSGGMVILSGCSGGTVNSLYAPSETSIAGILDRLTLAYPGFYWTIRDGAINVLPKGRWPEAMDLEVRHFDWDTSASVNLNINRVFQLSGISEAIAKLGVSEGLQQGFGLQRAPRIQNGSPDPPLPGRMYEVRNTTILAALNGIVVSYGTAFWVYEERACEGKTTYRLFTQDMRRLR